MGFFPWGFTVETLAQGEIFYFNDQGTAERIMVK
jgi:hypothetical protein